MSTRFGLIRTGEWVLCALFVSSPAWGTDLTTAEVREQADHAFQLLHQGEPRIAEEKRAPARQEQPVRYDPAHFLTGQGQGDLSKGKLVCQRVSELAARADIAKQIRVLIKEHATDRLRERTGREAEQDIEVVREEIVQEYLQGVKIIDRRADEELKTCSATAVMPKDQLSAPPSPQSAISGSTGR